MSATVHVELPAPLCPLAGVERHVYVTLDGEASQRTLLEALEAKHPVLLGTIRDRTTQERRPFIRFFACEQDLSFHSPDDALPDAVLRGTEPFLIVGAIAGG